MATAIASGRCIFMLCLSKVTSKQHCNATGVTVQRVGQDSNLRKCYSRAINPYFRTPRLTKTLLYPIELPTLGRALWSKKDRAGDSPAKPFTDCASDSVVASNTSAIFGIAADPRNLGSCRLVGLASDFGSNCVIKS